MWTNTFTHTRTHQPTMMVRVKVASVRHVSYPSSRQESSSNGMYSGWRKLMITSIIPPESQPCSESQPCRSRTVKILGLVVACEVKSTLAKSQSPANSVALNPTCIIPTGAVVKFNILPLRIALPNHRSSTMYSQSPSPPQTAGTSLFGCTANRFV